MHYWGTVMVRTGSAPSPSFEPDAEAQAAAAASAAFGLPLNPDLNEGTQFSVLP
jgi:hypothetical protein